MMGLGNPIHLAFILVVLLLVFGAKRLPEIGKSLGAGLRGFKDTIGGEDHLASITEHAPQRAEELATSTVHTDLPVESAVRSAQPVA